MDSLDQFNYENEWLPDKSGHNKLIEELKNLEIKYENLLNKYHQNEKMN